LFRYLNKATTISTNDRDTNQVFIETVHCATYAWNSSTIDGTDITRSVAAIGRPFAFPLDITLSTTPSPSYGNVANLHSFIRLAQRNSTFATEILKIITEERRTYHRERINATRNQSLFHLDDIIMVRVQVQSNAEINRVAKLSYRLRGPYRIIECTGHGAYFLQKLDQPNSPKLKYKSEDISLLPPAIRPVEPIDGPNLRYLNHNHASIHHPLKHAFNIELYNDIWFSQPTDSNPP
jgi:hypothetical protein